MKTKDFEMHNCFPAWSVDCLGIWRKEGQVIAPQMSEKEEIIMANWLVDMTAQNERHLFQAPTGGITIRLRHEH